MEAKKVFGWFIILVMVLSTVGFVLQDSDITTQTYNEIKFMQTNTGWKAKVNDKMQEFNFYPEILESIQVPQETEELKNKKAIIVTYNPDSVFSSLFAQLQYDYEQKLPKTIYVLRGATNGTSLPQYTCANATANIPVVLFDETVNNTITFQNNCLSITGNDGYGLASQAERILYVFLGVMKS